MFYPKLDFKWLYVSFLIDLLQNVPSLLGGDIQCTYIAGPGNLNMVMVWISHYKGLEPVLLLLLLHSSYKNRAAQGS